MKAILNDAASAAVAKIVERVRAFKPDSAKGGSTAINAIILEFAASATQAQFETLSERMVSPKKRHRGLIKLLSDCAPIDDPEAIQALEKLAKKLQQKRKNEPKKAQKDASPQV